MKRQQIYLFIGIAVLLLVIINWQKLMAFARNSPTLASAGGLIPTGSAGGGGTGSTGGSSGPYNPSQLLSMGSSGPAVMQLQKLMIDGWGAGILPKYGADGQFGPETEAALYQITGKASTTITTFTVHYYNPRIALRGTNIWH